MTSTEQDCDKLIRELGGTVITFGQKGRRTRNTLGVPDRLYFVAGRMIWFEVKAAKDRLRKSHPEQEAFLLRLMTYGQVAGCGNRADLLTLLNSTNPRKTGEAQVEKYRTERKALRGA